MLKWFRGEGVGSEKNWRIFSIASFLEHLKSVPNLVNLSYQVEKAKGVMIGIVRGDKLRLKVVLEIFLQTVSLAVIGEKNKV
jgi:hypothetical protein